MVEYLPRMSKALDLIPSIELPPSPPKDNFHFTNKEWEAWSCLVAHPKARSQEGTGLGFKLKILTEVHIQSKFGSYIFCELYCGICKAGMHLLNRINIHSFIYAWLQFLKATIPNHESKGIKFKHLLSYTCCHSFLVILTRPKSAKIASWMMSASCRAIA